MSDDLFDQYAGEEEDGIEEDSGDVTVEEDGFEATTPKNGGRRIHLQWTATAAITAGSAATPETRPDKYYRIVGFYSDAAQTLVSISNIRVAGQIVGSGDAELLDNYLKSTSFTDASNVVWGIIGPDRPLKFTLSNGDASSHTPKGYMICEEVSKAPSAPKVKRRRR